MVAEPLEQQDPWESRRDEDKPTSSSASSRARDTPAEDAKIRRLKEYGAVLEALSSFLANKHILGSVWLNQARI